MWRVLVAIMLLFGTVAGWPAAARAQEDPPTDLAAMLVPPSALPEPGYQLARGGYLTPDDVRYLLEQRYALDGDAIERLVDTVSWRQGYTGAYVLLSDRAIRTSDPIGSVTTTIHEFDSDDGAIATETLMLGAPPERAEELDGAVEGATTWRVVTSQDDTLVTVARSGRFVVEVVTAGRRQAPDAGDHASVVGETIARVEREPGTRLSQQLVLVEDARLIPVAVPTDAPLVHTWYRLLDGEVIPAGGEIEEPAPSDIAAGVDEIVISRQTAELSSQNWVTAGVVVASFASPADASAFGGVLRDPLDVFPVSEDVTEVDAGSERVAIEAISGETRVGGRYSGYRVTVVEDAMVAQIAIRSMGSTLISQEAVEAWADAQRQCLGGGECGSVSLVTLLRTPDPATPVAGAVEDGAYRSPVAPWSVRYDPETWEERERVAEGGYDYLYLRSERMDATFETIVDHQGDPEQCVLNELDRLRDDEERARITVGSDDADEPPGGLTEDHGWIVYTVEPLVESRAGEEYVIRIDCYTVTEGSSSLVVQVRAPRDHWSELAPMGEALRSRIEIEGVSVGSGTGDLPATTLTARSDDMINRRPWVGTAA